MGRIKRRIVVIVVGVLAVFVLGGGIAFAMASNSGGSPASATAICAPTVGTHGKRNGAAASDRTTKDLVKLASSGISGTLVVADSTAPGGYVTVTFARGQISNVNSASSQITVQLANNTTQTFTLGTGAVIQISKKTGTIASLKTGMNVLVLSRQAQGQAPLVSVLVQKAVGGSNSAGATPAATASS